MMIATGINELIERLGLQPHPEGGWFRETRRSERMVETPHGSRPADTAIDFLLAADQISRIHRLRQEETWIYRAGPGLDLHLFRPGGRHARHRLAPGALGQVIVPSSVWMGAEAGGGWALVECVCVPGFDFADLEFAERAAMLAGWPDEAALLERLIP